VLHLESTRSDDNCPKQQTCTSFEPIFEKCLVLGNDDDDDDDDDDDPTTERYEFCPVSLT